MFPVRAHHGAGAQEIEAAVIALQRVFLPRVRTMLCLGSRIRVKVDKVGHKVSVLRFSGEPRRPVVVRPGNRWDDDRAGLPVVRPAGCDIKAIAAEIAVERPADDRGCEIEVSVIRVLIFLQRIFIRPRQKQLKQLLRGKIFRRVERQAPFLRKRRFRAAQKAHDPAVRRLHCGSPLHGYKPRAQLRVSQEAVFGFPPVGDALFAVNFTEALRAEQRLQVVIVVPDAGVDAKIQLQHAPVGALVRRIDVPRLDVGLLLLCRKLQKVRIVHGPAQLVIGDGDQQKVLRIRADLVIEDVQLPFGRVQSAEADAELSLFGKEERAPGSRHLQNRPIRRAVNRLCRFPAIIEPVNGLLVERIETGRAGRPAERRFHRVSKQAGQSPVFRLVQGEDAVL